MVLVLFREVAVVAEIVVAVLTIFPKAPILEVEVVVIVVFVVEMAWN